MQEVRHGSLLPCRGDGRADAGFGPDAASLRPNRAVASGAALDRGVPDVRGIGTAALAAYPDPALPGVPAETDWRTPGPGRFRSGRLAPRAGPGPARPDHGAGA